MYTVNYYSTIQTLGLSNNTGMTKKKATQPTVGPSQELVSRILYLQQLLKALPHILPLDPELSRYQFAIDTEDIAEYGPLGAFSRCMEAAFETFRRRDGVIEFTERGERLEKHLIGTMRAVVKVMSEIDRTVFKEAWLERLITTAKRHGASTGKRKRQQASASTGSGPSTASSQTHSTEDSLDEVAVDSSSESDGVPEICPPPPQRQNMKQTSLIGAFRPLHEWSAAEMAEQKRREEKKRAAERKVIEKKERVRRKNKEEHQRTLGRERVRAYRARKKAKVDEDEIQRGDANEALMTNSKNLAEAPKLLASEIAEASRPDRQAWRGLRSGKNGGAKQERVKRTNWFHPFLWVSIDLAMRRTDWSAAAAVKALQRENPQMFARLHRGTVHKWKASDGSQGWSASTLEKIKVRHSLAGSGRTGVLAGYPEVVLEIKTVLRDLRISGLPVNAIIGRSVMIAIIKKHEPAILSSQFQCSERFVRAFFESTMNWAPRQATRAAAHVPVNAADLCERTFFRLVYAMKWEDIPSNLVINADQMGMYVLPSNSRTFHDKGADQVDVHGKEEKRAFTLMVASTPSGAILPFQQIWGGKTRLSLPSGTSQGKSEADSRGFKFHVAASPSSPRSHFSTVKNMKEWVLEIVIPYRLSIVERDGLPDDQKIILYIDCYPVHTGEEFRAWLRSEHPYIILIYVPANCTGIFQPADVGLQRPIKHILKQHIFSYLVQVHQEQIASGISAEDIRITTSITKLRDASVAGLVAAHDFLISPGGRDLIQMAWRKSEAKDWCLSEACLTGRDAQQALNDYLKQDITLFEEIREQIGAVQGLDNISTPAEDDIDHSSPDDTDVPLHAVINSTVRQRMRWDFGDGLFTVNEVEDGEKDPNQPGLIAASADEDVWQFDDNGRRWNECNEGPLEQSDIEE
ncbi:hypothetical protein EYR38_009772 [Pleurotus pulmonarius]|nr:hypothetical protein EYR38_009772 [Pleurotus pulmonarius]